MVALEKDRRYQQYLYEKSLLEQYGQASSITYEDWLDIKGYNNNEKHPFIQIEDGLKEEFINKACQWLKDNLENYYYHDEAYDQVISVKNVINDFKKYMQG